MLDLPSDLLTSGVLPYLSIRDLQAVNVAFTSTPTHRARIKELWKSYSYECIDGRAASLNELKWLRSVEVRVVSIISSDEECTVEVFEFVHQNFPMLRKLSVLQQIHYYDEDACDDVLLAKLASGCPLLEEFSAPSWYVSDMGILSFVKKCTQLHTLKIFDSIHITDAAIETICLHCPFLKYVGVYSCCNLTDASLIMIANAYPNIQSIDIMGSNFTDDGLIYLVDKCHELRSVSVQYNNIRSRGLTALWAANPNLIDVDISDNYFISDDDIIQLVQCCPLLQKLSISFCELLSDAAVIAVVEHCPQLRALDIRYCKKISDVSLIALGQHCHELKSINISGLKNISDLGIAALAAGCPLLQELYAIKTNITDAGVVALARGCRNLRKIGVHSVVCLM